MKRLNECACQCVGKAFGKFSDFLMEMAYFGASWSLQ